MAVTTISDVQSALNTLGYATPLLVVDGVAGPLTQAAVRAFQQSHPPLAVDGDAGPLTMAALESALVGQAAGGAAADVANVTNLAAAAPAPAPASTLLQILGASVAPAAPRVVSIPSPLGATAVHLNTVTGTSKTVAAGTKVPTAANPSTWTGAEKLFAGAAAVAAFFGLKKYWPRIRAMVR